MTYKVVIGRALFYSCSFLVVVYYLVASYLLAKQKYDGSVA